MIKPLSVAIPSRSRTAFRGGFAFPQSYQHLRYRGVCYNVEAVDRDGLRLTSNLYILRSLHTSLTGDPVTCKGSDVGRTEESAKLKYKKDSFIVIPNKDFLIGKPPEMQTIYLWLCHFADKNGQCFPSRKTIATCGGVSMRTVDKYITELELCGFIEKTNRFKKGVPEKTSNLYQLLVKGSAGRALPLEQDMHEGSAGGAHRTQSNELNPILTQGGVPPQDVAEVIDSFKDINPVAKNWFKNTTQRKASEQLIEIMGTKDKVIHFVSRVLPGINSRKYAPKSTTPNELLNNLAKIKSFVEQEKEKKVGIIL